MPSAASAAAAAAATALDGSRSSLALITCMRRGPPPPLMSRAAAAACKLLSAFAACVATAHEGARARRCVRHRWSTHESARFVSAPAGECGGAMGAPLAAGWESDRIMAAASWDSGRIDCARRAKVEARSGVAPVTVAEAEALPALATLVRISMSCVIIVASAPAVKVMLPTSTRCLPTRFLSSLVSSFACLKGTPYSTAMSTSPGRTTTIPA